MLEPSHAHAAIFEVIILVPGLPLYEGRPEAPRLVGRSTHGVRDVFEDGRGIPVHTRDESLVGRAVSMERVDVDGEPGLRFRAELSRPPEEFRRRPDGALVGGMHAVGGVRGVYPRGIYVTAVR